MAVLETPWFMKTKTSDLGRVNKLFDERFLASVAQLEIKKRKTLSKLDEQIKNIKVEFKQIRTDVNFSTDLDEYGKTLEEEAAVIKSETHGARKGNGQFVEQSTSNSIPLSLEMERQRYLRLIGRSRKRQMTMIELREMCHRCVRKEETDEASSYLKQARLILFPKPKRVKHKTKHVERSESNGFSINTNETLFDDRDSRNEQSRANSQNVDDIPRVDRVADRVARRPRVSSSSGRALETIKSNFPSLKSLTFVSNSDIIRSDDINHCLGGH